MLDISHTLVHKLTLQINRCVGINSEISVADLVKGILYDRLSEKYQLTSDWNAFARGGKLTSTDEVLKGNAALAVTDDKMIWAAYLNIKDAESPRRRWIYYISQKSDNDDTTTLYYAKCCYDHMAGSIMDAKPLPAARDALPDPLFFNRYIQCMCGVNAFSGAAEELTHTTLPDLLNYLRDKTRRQPVFLITCCWYLSPEKLADELLGNAIVFWCDNSSVVMRLNSMLPSNMYTPWDSVRIFMPDSGDKTFHPLYELDVIRQMGIDRFNSGLRQAYCQSMRSEDRRSFLTVEDVYNIKRRQQVENLTRQLADRDDRLATAAKQSADLKKTNSVLQEELRQLTSVEPPKDTAEYETLLTESIRETDDIKQGIQRLMSRLCVDMGMSFQPDASEPCAMLLELANTIYACLQRVSNSK